MAAACNWLESGTASEIEPLATETETEPEPKPSEAEPTTGPEILETSEPETRAASTKDSEPWTAIEAKPKPSEAEPTTEPKSLVLKLYLVLYQ